MEKNTFCEVVNTVWNNGGKAFSGEIVRIREYSQLEDAYKVTAVNSTEVLYIKESNLRPIETSGFKAKIAYDKLDKKYNKKHNKGDEIIILEVNEDETKVLIQNRKNYFIGWVNEDLIASSK